ncbi:Four helix bundle sensory module for signal transduction [compost metagenome]
MNKVFALLERLPLRRKLILGFSVLLVLILVLGVQSLRTQELLKRDMHQLYQRELIGIGHLHEARVQLPHLIQLLKESDTAAMEALKALQTMDPGPAQTKLLAQVAQQVELFDFDRALALLQGLPAE